MKRLALLSIWLALPLLLVGCKTVTAPLPAWAPTAPIAAAGEVIASGNAAVVQYQKDVAAGYVAPAALQAKMSDLQQALSVAQPVFDTWETAARTNAAAAEPAALPAQITRISTDLTQLTLTAGAQ